MELLLPLPLQLFRVFRVVRGFETMPRLRAAERVLGCPAGGWEDAFDYRMLLLASAGMVEVRSRWCACEIGWVRLFVE